MDPGHKARDDRVRLVSNDEKASLTLWRKFTAAYAALLSWLLVLSVAILVIPVSLQIFSRYTALIPSYIWTEEMARFLFIWTIMIGAMIGVRESTHFEVDVWPQLSRRGEAMVRLAGRLGVGPPQFAHDLPAPPAAGVSPVRGRSGPVPDRIISNARLKRVLSWSPHYPDFRAGYEAILGGVRG